MNAAFSRKAAEVLNSPYFSYQRWEGPQEKMYEWTDALSAEREVLEGGLHAGGKGVDSYDDLPDDAKKVWDKALQFKLAAASPPALEGESHEAYDLRQRMTDVSEVSVVDADEEPLPE